MNSERDNRELGIETGAAAPADAETRLKLNREILRQRLAQENKNDVLGDIDGIVSIAAPSRVSLCASILMQACPAQRWPAFG